VVAVVGNTPITASEVEFDTQLRARVQASADPSEFGRLLTERVDALEALVFRAILLSQPDIASASVLDPSPAEARLAALERACGSREAAEAFLADWGYERAAMLEFFKETVSLDRYVELSVDVRVREEEERAYYEQHRDDVFGGRPYEDVAAFVSRQVYLLRFEAEYNSWRSRLRAGAQKRYIR
jgi:hypothetical protein